MKTLLCIIKGKHNLELKHVRYGYEDHLTWDTKGDFGVRIYDVYLYKCDSCGVRSYEVTGGRKDGLFGGWGSHPGVIRLINKWMNGLEV